MQYKGVCVTTQQPEIRQMKDMKYCNSTCTSRDKYMRRNNVNINIFFHF